MPLLISPSQVHAGRSHKYLVKVKAGPKIGPQPVNPSSPPHTTHGLSVAEGQCVALNLTWEMFVPLRWIVYDGRV